MTLPLQIAVWIVALPFVGGSLYLGLLATIAMLPARRRRTPTASSLRRFSFVVPARNEAARIGALIESVHALDYPPERVSLVVIADNCTDDTAGIARAHGANVVERFDRERVGKGYALKLGLEHLPDDYDAVVFVDGDCAIDAAFLQAISRELDEGADAVQAYYTMAPASNEDAGAVRALALALVHYVRPLAKERIRASAGLKGSGMCFSRRLIDELGWSASGLAEDVEQHVRVLRAGYRVEFARDAIVVGSAPAALDQAEAQHTRWEAGRAAAARRHGAELLLDGLRTASIARADAGIELLLPPLSVLVAGVLALGSLGIIVRWPLLITATALSGACIAWYVVSGLLLQRLGWRGTLDAVISIPRYALWKLRVYAGAVVHSPAQWEPTRADEEPRAH